MLWIPAHSQTDKGFSYQAVARDPNGALYNQSALELRFYLHEGSPTGNLVYQEVHMLTSNAFGLIHTTIGKGTTESGTFSQIEWVQNDHYLLVEMDGQMIDTTQLEGVPYAMVATAMDLEDLRDVSTISPTQNQILKWNGTAWVPSEDETGASFNAGSGLSLSNDTLINTAPDQVVSLSGGGATTVSGIYPDFTIQSTDNVDDADADPNNEIQTLSQTGSNVLLSQGGGSVNIDDADADPNNEIQTLSRNGFTLTLSDGGGNVSLPTYTGGTGIDVTGTTITNTGDTNAGDDITISTAAGGDLSGTYPNPTVDRLQGQAVSASSPTSGQVLKWNGSAWAPSSDNTGSSVWSTSGINAFYNTGDVGIGTSAPDAGLEVRKNSSLSDPHVLLSENGNDYARLNFDNNNGSNYWTIAAYVASNNRNDRLNFWNGASGDLLSLTGDGRLGLNVGISPKTTFHVGNRQRVLFGTDTLGNGDKLMFLPDLHAFRVGTVSTGAASTYWNRDSIGLYSFASGLNTRAQGFGATAMGRDTEATNSYAFASGFFTNADGQYSTAMGFNTDAFALGSTALGYSTDAEANYSFATGYFAQAEAIYSIAIGSSVQAQSFASTAMGRYNVGGGSATSWVSSDPIFEIGIGTSPSARANAVTVHKNGNVGIGTTFPQDLLHVLGRVRIGSIEYLEDGGTNQMLIRGSLRPFSDNTYDLGTGSFRWDDVFATNGTINTSDIRDKENIQDIPYGLETVLQLNPISFTWRHDPQNQPKLGLSAQDLLKVIPEVVKTHDIRINEETNEREEYEMERMGVYYADLIPVLIQATQDQQMIIEKQQSLIEQLEKRVQDLEDR
ncbi:MAG: tail fiber domain-containing protein [Bacteroidota bacterium]